MSHACIRANLQACNFVKKETLAQVFSCEFCEISKNTFLQNTSGRLLLFIVIEHLRMTACDVKFDL